MSMKKKLTELVNEGKSTREIATAIGMSQTNVRYHLRKHSLKTAPATRTRSLLGEKISCEICERAVPSRRKCCNSCRTKIRRIRTKKAAVAMLGGKCVRCPEDDFVVLEFHHLRDKDFALGGVANKSWDVVKKELEKCELLCANCHRRHHSDRGNEKLLEKVAAYNGRLLDF